MNKIVPILIVTPYGAVERTDNFPEWVLAWQIVKDGGQVLFYTLEFDGWTGSKVREGVHVRRIPRPGDLFFSKQLFRQIVQDRHRFKVLILSHLRNPLALTAFLAARFLRKPVISVPLGILHDDFLVKDRDHPLETPLRVDNITTSWGQLVRQAFQGQSFCDSFNNFAYRYPLWHSDVIVATSRFEATKLKEIGLASPVACIYAGIESKAYQADGCPTGKASQSYNGFSRPVLFFLGQLKLRKGWDLLIRALPAVKERFPGVTLIFASAYPDGAGWRQVEKLGRECGVVDNVRFYKGGLSEKQKIRFYQISDAFVMPTRYEGFGLPVLEAMAIGCPVVTVNVPAVNEIITDGENGILARYDDPTDLATRLSQLLADDALRQRIVEQGHRRVQDFDASALYAQYLSLINSLKT